MPTTITKVIGSGGDYSTITLWEAAIPSNLVTADEIWVGECKNQTFSEGVSISGITTDSTRYVELKCQSGASFKDNAGVRTNPLIYNTSNGMAIVGNWPLYINVNYTRVNGLQIANSTSYGQVIYIDNGVSNTTVSQCILKISSGGDVSTPAYRANNGTNIIINSLIQGTGHENVAASYNCEMVYCTVVCDPAATNIRFGLNGSYGNLKAINCAVFGWGTAYGDTAASGSGYNASDSATAYGSNNQSSLTYSNQFENTSSDYRSKSTGGLQHGTPATSYLTGSVDISGQARDATTPWIGCWEVAAAATKAPPSFRRPARFFQRSF